MKIARIVFELDFGGVEKVTELAVKGFHRFGGLKIQVISLGKGGQVSEGLLREGQTVWVMNRKAKIPDFLLIYRLYRFFKKEKFDVVHTVGAEPNFHGLWAAWLAGVPFRVGEEIGYPNHHFFYRALFKWTYFLAHRVICVSNAVKNQLHAIGELSLAKATVIYNPIALPELNERNAFQNQQLVFISVSRLTAIKNTKAIIHALAIIIRETDFRPSLLIVGEGEDQDSLKAVAIEQGINKYIEFKGYQQDVFEFLGQADVFVLTSFSEGSSLALAEAMHAALPSIVTQSGGASEILGDSNSGILVDPNSLEEIKKAMLGFLKMDVTERLAIGKRAKKQVDKFSVENYCKDLFELYRPIQTKKTT